MPPQIAAICCILFVGYLFWADRKKSDNVSIAIWIPQIWMFIAGSRFVSHWLNLGAVRGSNVFFEGSPIDRTIFIVLIFAGVIVLQRRKISWNALFILNLSVFLYFIYGGMSIIWSDFPFVAFKRLVKSFGNVIMVLIILTELYPISAIGLIIKRMTFLLIPLSVLFIKYYPHIGRAYHMGKPMYTGVTPQKNSLGMLCLICGIYLCWILIVQREKGLEIIRRIHWVPCLILVSMIIWLFYKANSATSTFCIMVAILILLMSRLRVVKLKPQRIFIIGIVCAALFIIFDLSFDIKEMVITLLGRKADLTTRVPMWNYLFSMVKDPLVGFGFESFWLGDRQSEIIRHFSVAFNAHNGYLEMYLHLGVIGLLFVAGWYISGFWKVAKQIKVDPEVAMLKFCMIIVVAFYSWTEAVFYGVNNLWVLLFFSIIEIPEISTEDRNL